jgi:O-antigen/teichoic acid export membrane protein
MTDKKKDLYWLKSAILTVLQSMSGVLLGFGSFYMLVRLLTKYEFGAWTLFTATTTILEFVRNGLVQNFYRAHHRKKGPELSQPLLPLAAHLLLYLS